MKLDLAFYESILNSVGDIVYVRDPEMNILYMNAAAERILGLSNAEAQKHKCYDLFGDRPLTCKDNCPGMKVLNDETALWHTEGAMVSKDGDLIKLGASVSPFFQGGELKGAIFVLQDITRQRAIEETHLKALTKIEQEVRLRKQSENRLQLILSNAPEGIVSFDKTLTIRSGNPASEAMFQHSDHSFIGMHVSQLIPSLVAETPDITATPEGALLHLPAGLDGKYETLGLRANGESFPLELAVSEYMLDGDVMYSAVISDITERNRIETMKREFLATVSHELRTPLTSIIGSLGLIVGTAAGSLNAKVLRMVEIAQINADRLLKLINEILDMSRMEAGHIDMERIWVSVGDLLHKALEANQGYADKQGVVLRLEGEPPPLSVFADPARIAQVMGNLISNAAKFSQRDDLVLITASEEDDKVRIDVKDHGKGIPPEFHSRLFRRFSQVDSSDARGSGGTGLGLSICKSIIEAHGGRIWFESELGKGTTFMFELAAQPSAGGAA